MADKRTRKTSREQRLAVRAAKKDTKDRAVVERTRLTKYALNPSTWGERVLNNFQGAA